MLKINGIELKSVHVFANPVREGHTRVWLNDSVNAHGTGYYEVSSTDLDKALSICDDQFEVTII